MLFDASAGRPCCEVALQYPAPCVGKWLIKCDLCGTNAIVTAAGRRDAHCRWAAGDGQTARAVLRRLGVNTSFVATWREVIETLVELWPGLPHSGWDEVRERPRPER
jgi:hypothetical protein